MKRNLNVWVDLVIRKPSNNKFGFKGEERKENIHTEDCKSPELHKSLIDMLTNEWNQKSEKNIYCLYCTWILAAPNQICMLKTEEGISFSPCLIVTKAFYRCTLSKVGSNYANSKSVNSHTCLQVFWTVQAVKSNSKYSIGSLLNQNSITFSSYMPVSDSNNTLQNNLNF